MQSPVAQGVITIIGLVGLTTLIDLIRRGGRWTRLQRFLRLKYHEPIDIVLNAAVDSGRPLAEVDNQVVFGSVKSAALLSDAVGRTRGRKELRLHLGDSIDSKLDNDLIILGGTARSTVGRMFLAELEQHLGSKLVYFDEDDEDANQIIVGHYQVTFDWTTAVQDKDSSVDYALVIAWRNPFAGRFRRAFWVSGFTSFGTFSAIEYLLGYFLETRKRAVCLSAFGLQRDRPPLLGPPASLSQPGIRALWWPSFALVLEIRSVNGQCVQTREMGIVRLSLRSKKDVRPTEDTADRPADRISQPDVLLPGSVIDPRYR